MRDHEKIRTREAIENLQLMLEAAWGASAVNRASVRARLPRRARVRRARVCVCVRACVRACVRVCAWTSVCLRVRARVAQGLALLELLSLDVPLFHAMVRT